MEDPSLRWKASKKRSSKQMLQISSLRATTNARKENLAQIGNSALDSALPRSHTTASRTPDTSHKVRNANKRAKQAQGKLGILSEKLSNMQNENLEHTSTISALESQLDTASSEIEQLVKSVNNLRIKNHALVVRKNRAPAQKDLAIKTALGKVSVEQKTYSLKNSGVVKDAIRSLARNMCIQNVPVDNVMSVIEMVADTFGVELDGKISDRSIRRFVGEGGVYAQMQAGELFNNAEGTGFIYFDVFDLKSSSTAATMSGDGTPHRHINYESGFINVTGPGGEKATLFMGINSATDHTAEMQLNGWKVNVNNIATAHNLTPEGKANPCDPRELAMKTIGMNSDHAEDQKKKARLFQAYRSECDRQIRGETVLAGMSEEQLGPVLWEAIHTAIEASGGLDAWDGLSEAEREARYTETMSVISKDIGTEAYNTLPDDAKKKIDFFAWVGCCMHKDMNAVKGGNTAMQASWESEGLTGPKKLPNRDIAAARGSAAADVQGGCIKLVSLAGALFNHKDDKKGWQDSHRWFFERALGRRYTFPDTSNTRYQSHAQAAAELVLHRQLYLDFMLTMKDKKESRTFTNMEKNVYEGLQDLETFEELCVHALYEQIITDPYLEDIRNSPEMNALDLGPLHEKVIAKHGDIIDKPSILFASESSTIFASLDGKPWHRPEVVSVIMELWKRSELPHLQSLMLAFLVGARDTWTRFSSEFADGGIIASASEDQKRLAWMPATNDRNEGALGTLRVALRKCPSMTLHTFNAKMQYKMNHTDSWVRSLTDNTVHQIARKEARRIDSSGLERQRKALHVEAIEKSVAAKRARIAERMTKKKKAAEEVDRCIKQFDREKLARMKVKELDLQLRWHRRFDPEVPIAARLKNKAERLTVLSNAVDRFLLMDEARRQELLDPDLNGAEQNMENLEEVQDDWHSDVGSEDFTEEIASI